MPKSTTDFPDRLEFMCSHDLKIKLIALGFLTGHGQQYSVMARNLLTQAIETAVAGLEPKRRKAYEEIMANVRIQYPDPLKSKPPGK